MRRGDDIDALASRLQPVEQGDAFPVALHLAVVRRIAGDEHNIAPVILCDLVKGGLQHLWAIRQQLLAFGIGGFISLAGNACFFGIIMNIGNNRQGQRRLLFSHMDASRFDEMLPV